MVAFSPKPKRAAKIWTDINLGVRKKLYFPFYRSCALSQWDVISKDSALSVLGLGTDLLLQYVFSYLKEFLNENFGLHILLQRFLYLFRF
jgi:hypothetical protein